MKERDRPLPTQNSKTDTEGDSDPDIRLKAKRKDETRCRRGQRRSGRMIGDGGFCVKVIAIFGRVFVNGISPLSEFGQHCNDSVE